MNPPPVWAPMQNFPDAMVPFARNGLRTWDSNGPGQ